MKKTLLLVVLCFPSLFFSQVVLNQIDDFEDYTNRNWTKNNSIPNTNVYDDGPLGVGDNFLRVTSSGSGTGLNLLTLNNAQWTGNYYQSNGGNKITYISMDVRNSGTNVIFLRMSFKYTVSSTTIEIWSTTNAVAVLPGEGWKKINFQIDAANVVRVSGLNPYSSTFNNVQETRILHNDAPSWDSDPIVAVLDIDNIMARNTPALDTDEFSANNKIVVYPNPANNYITIYNNDNLVDSFKFRIIDITGRTIIEGNSKYNEQITIDKLTKGNYIIQIENENGETTTSSLIKN